LGLIYDDGSYYVMRFYTPGGAGSKEPPHNHGAWNISSVYRGAAHYRSYRRLDDRSEPYVADLEVVVDRVMREGDVEIVPEPPHDIHDVATLAPMTVSLVVGREPFDQVREMYLLDRRAYFLQDQSIQRGDKTIPMQRVSAED
jgi:predicted metal-dependent enzyme (double-stranded beta helix superfamily)